MEIESYTIGTLYNPASNMPRQSLLISRRKKFGASGCVHNASHLIT
jgi:hypothetical protein